MPELPEVENVRRQLEAMLDLVAPSPTKPRPRRYLLGAEFFRKDLRFPFSKKLRDRVQAGKHLGPVLGIERRAKYLLFRFESGLLLSHLGMTGAWREIGRDTSSEVFRKQRGKHDHVRLLFDNGQSFVFEDPRRFGYMDWVDAGVQAQHKLLKHLGPEPLGPDFDAEYLFRSTRGKTSTIKSFVMDGRRVVGVGNIYASEALYRAKIRPTRKAGKLNQAEAESLVVAIRDVLKAAIESGGSSIRDFKGADGYRGGFQDLHLVYDRAGEPCRTCGTKIVSKQITGRSTFWCPNCQPK